LPLEDAGAAGVAGETGATVSHTLHRFANGLGVSIDPAPGIPECLGNAAQRSIRSMGHILNGLNTFAER
jgi:hypothetical protein